MSLIATSGSTTTTDVMRIANDREVHSRNLLVDDTGNTTEDLESTRNSGM